MSKVIVTTTIHLPTPAIELFDANPDWTLIVVTDRKTPPEYRLKRGIVVTPEMQEKYDPELSEAIGWDCIQRRNFGLLWAKDLGAEVVAVVDDDNIPYDFWGRDLLVGLPIEVDYYDTNLPAFDPVGATGHPHLWHRGFPLQLLARRDYSQHSRRTIVPDIQADFWDGDPDVDAICRMEHAPTCRFSANAFPLSSNRPAPFNSQNTFISGKWLKDYFLFPHIGRMDDIWAAFYVQALGAQVVFHRASVRQDRNTHDLTADMAAEFRGYEKNLELINALLSNAEQIQRFLPDRSWRAFRLYQRHFA